MAWRKHGVELEPDNFVGLPEHRPALGVPDDDIANVELRQHLGAHLAGEGAGVLEVAGLGPERDRHRVGLERCLHRAQGGERRVERDVGAVRHRGGAQKRGELLHDLDRLVVGVVHLPVAADEQPARLALALIRPPQLAGLPSPAAGPRRLSCRRRLAALGASRSASRPGRSPNSSSSSEAPPPVETWSILSSSPSWPRAATLSPPPTTVRPGQAAIASAIALVPAAKRASSNTPIGPFHKHGAAEAITSAKAARSSPGRCRRRASPRVCPARRSPRPAPSRPTAASSASSAPSMLSLRPGASDFESTGSTRFPAEQRSSAQASR